MSPRRAGDIDTDPKSKPEDWTFGRWLRHLRRRRCGWSQSQLARHMVRVAVDFEGSANLLSLKPMISKWENDRIEPEQYNLHLLAETLGLDADELGLWVDPTFRWRRRGEAA